MYMVILTDVMRLEVEEISSGRDIFPSVFGDEKKE